MSIKKPSTEEVQIKNWMSKIDTDTRVTNNLLNKKEMDYYNKFNRVGVLDPYSKLRSNKQYVFFTKPNLQIMKSSNELKDHFANSTFFRDALRMYKDCLYQLQSSISSKPYINLASTRLISPLEMPDVSAGEVDNAANIYGDSISYRWSSGSSDMGFDFSLEFEDSKYLEVYMLFKIWDEYFKTKQKGLVDIPSDFVLNRILHDQISIFKITVDGEDNETILHYCKYTGVYPKDLSRGALTNIDDGVKINVGFKAFDYDDMKPEIIGDINEIYTTYKKRGTMSISSDDIPLFNPNMKGVDTRWVNIPLIDSVKDSRAPGGVRYKLKWR